MTQRKASLIPFCLSGKITLNTSQKLVLRAFQDNFIYTRACLFDRTYLIDETNAMTLEGNRYCLRASQEAT